MDDEGADWLSEDVVEEAPAASDSAAAEEAQGDAPAGEEAPAEETRPEAEPEEPPRPRDPNRPILYRHWQRPVNAQYNYLYDYRKNYYDDVIDYMDRRSRGIYRDIPRAQTWAERALRTYVKNGNTRSVAYERSKTDVNLMNSIHTGAKFYHYHTKEYMSRRYPVLLR